MADTIATAFTQTRGQANWAKRSGGLEAVIETHRLTLNSHAADIDTLVAGSITNNLAFSVNTQSSAVDAAVSTFADLQVLTMTAASKTYTLPAATTTYEGQTIVVFNNGGTHSFDLDDNGGGLISAIPAGEFITIICEDNSDAAGTWRILRQSLNMFSDVTISSGLATNDMLVYTGSVFEDRTPAEVRAHLDLEPGTDVQAYDADTAKTDVEQDWTAHQYYAIQTLSDGANIAWDVDSEPSAKVTLAGNRTLDNPTGMVDGGSYRLRVIQDGTGSRTLSYGVNYNFGDAGEPDLSTAANSVDILYFESDGTDMFFIGIATGF